MLKQYIILFVFLILYNLVINWLEKIKANQNICFFLGNIFILIYLFIYSYYVWFISLAGRRKCLIINEWEKTKKSRDFRNRVAKVKRKAKKSGGGTCILALILLLPFWILSGFNKNKAVSIYQERYAQYFSCPYKNKTGLRCSDVFRQEGFKALVCKCKNKGIS